MGALRSEYTKSPSRLTRRQSNELTRLLRPWPKARAALEAERRRLLRQKPRDESLPSAVDLPNPIPCALGETLHKPSPR